MKKKIILILVLTVLYTQVLSGENFKNDDSETKKKDKKSFYLNISGTSSYYNFKSKLPRYNMEYMAQGLSLETIWLFNSGFQTSFIIETDIPVIDYKRSILNPAGHYSFLIGLGVNKVFEHKYYLNINGVRINLRFAVGLGLNPVIIKKMSFATEMFLYNYNESIRMLYTMPIKIILILKNISFSIGGHIPLTETVDDSVWGLTLSIGTDF